MAIARIIKKMEDVKDDNAEANEKYLRSKLMEGRTKFGIPSTEKLDAYQN